MVLLESGAHSKALVYIKKKDEAHILEGTDKRKINWHAFFNKKEAS